MNILLALLPLSLVLLGIAIWAFLRAVRGGQFDDLETPPLDMLGDDERPRPVGRRRAGDGERDGADDVGGGGGGDGGGGGGGNDAAPPSAGKRAGGRD